MMKLGRIACLFGRHDYYRIAQISGTTRHVGCRKCDRQWGMNDDARALVPWHMVADDMLRMHGYAG